MKLLILLALLVQTEETIPKAHKAAYTTATKNCETAEECIDSDPVTAVDLLDPIIDDRRIDKYECRIRIEILPGTYSKWYNFYPYQFRGRALINQADKKGDVTQAQRLLRQAVSDLQESVDRGLRSSSSYLETAKKKLDALSGGGTTATPAPVDPEPEFRREWNRLIDSDRFASAKKHIESQGSFLSEEKRAQYVRDTESRCREYLNRFAERFLREVTRIRSAEDLRTMRGTYFDRDFELPPDRELAAPSPPHDWCVAVRKVFEDFRAGKEVLDGLFDQAVEGIKLVPKGDSPWFHPLHDLARELVEKDIQKRVDDARLATAEDRRKLRGEAESVRQQWKSFLERARRVGKDRPEFLRQVTEEDFARLFAEFPVDVEGLDEIVAKLDSSAHADSPDAALAEADRRLREVESNGSRLSVESRRLVLTYRVIVTALRGFLDGQTSSEVASAVRSLGSELRGVGGPVPEDVKKYGPKIEKVFAGLR